MESASQLLRIVEKFQEPLKKSILFNIQKVLETEQDKLFTKAKADPSKKLTLADFERAVKPFLNSIESGRPTSSEPKWKKVLSKSKGKYYYFNSSTGTSVWEPPADYIEPPASNPHIQNAARTATKQKKPVAVFICGPAGAGKSSFVKMVHASLSGPVIIANVDAVLENLVPWDTESDEALKEIYRRVTSYFYFDVLFPVFCQSKHPLIVEGTCRDVASTKRTLLKPLVDANYYTVFCILEVSKETAWARVEQRQTAGETKRVLTKPVVNTIHNNFQRAKPSYMGLGDELFVFNNDGGAITKIFERGAGAAGGVGGTTAGGGKTRRKHRMKKLNKTHARSRRPYKL